MHPTITSELMRQRVQERIGEARRERRSVRPPAPRRRKSTLAAGLRAVLRHA